MAPFCVFCLVILLKVLHNIDIRILTVTLKTFQLNTQALSLPESKLIGLSNIFLCSTECARVCEVECDQIGRFFAFLGKHSKPVATTILPKLPTMLGNFCISIKIIHFWATFIDIWRFYTGHTGEDERLHHQQQQSGLPMGTPKR